MVHEKIWFLIKCFVVKFHATPSRKVEAEKLFMNCFYFYIRLEFLKLNSFVHGKLVENGKLVEEKVFDNDKLIWRKFAPNSKIAKILERIIEELKK